MYLLLAVFFLAIATFVYGFLNGKKIHSFAAQVSDIQSKHNLEAQIEKIESSFRENGKKEISQIRDESKQFSDELNMIAKEAESAKREGSSLGAPPLAENLKKDVQDYYSKIALEAADLKGIIDFMSQIIDVAAVFGEMQEKSSLDEMKNLIARAKEKGDAVKTDILPQTLQVDAQNLKDSMNSFLLKMEEMATLKSENSVALDESYDDFSQKEDIFFAASKKYIDGMENLDIMKERINAEIERLGKVKFSLK